MAAPNWESTPEIWTGREQRPVPSRLIVAPLLASTVRGGVGDMGNHKQTTRDRALSGAACGLYRGIRGFDAGPDPFFKTSNDTGAKDLRLSIPRELPQLTGRT